MSDYPIHSEIQPKVHLIRGSNNARFPEANCLFIDDEILTLVDAGSNIDHVRKTMKDLGHEIRDLDRIVLTHFHIDHKGYAAFIQKESECEVLCHTLAEAGVRSFRGLVDLIGIGDHHFHNDWIEYVEAVVPHVKMSYEVSGTFHDCSPISCGETTLLPIHSPGHSADHTCFGINGNDTIFLVDIDLTNFGPWYGNVTSDVRFFKNSIRRVLDLDPKVGISSHLINPVTEGLRQRLEDYLHVIDVREERLLKLVAQGHNTVSKLVKVPTIYPRIPIDAFYFFEELMVEKHLDILVEDGRVELEGGLIIPKREGGA